MLALQLTHAGLDFRATGFTDVTFTRLLYLAAFAVLGPMSFFEHSRSVAPSTLITTFLVSCVLCDAIQAGQLYVAKNLCEVSMLSVASFVVKAALMILETQSKAILREPYEHSSPEEVSGFWGTAFFWWVNEFIALGYSKILSNEDMPPLPSYLDSQHLRERMLHAWNRKCTCVSPVQTCIS